MVEHANQEKLVFSLGDPNVTARCPVTNRLYEAGSGALSHQQQTAAFVRERDIAADMPRPGECAPDGRPYETGAGCLTKSAQRAMWSREADPAQAQRDDARAAATEAASEVQRLAKVESDALDAALNAWPVAGSA
jgi:hypothetical protein